MVPDQFMAFGVIDQEGQIDHLQRHHGGYRLRDDAGHRSNQKLSRKAKICHRTWSDGRTPRLRRQHSKAQDEPRRDHRSRWRSQRRNF
jgi:hypothetical protein